ncbi:MAG: ATP synthase F1 subunit epsilon [Clostridiales bacterium]|nr:ATP synthase F1 subunit epsilon [Clostridiales bacterium]
MGTFRLRLVSPMRLMYDGDVDMVIMRAKEGDIAFMSGHIPLTTALGYGIMKIIKGEETREASVFGGFVEANGKSVTVLSDMLEWPDEIDIKRAERARERAERAMQEAKDQVEYRRAELAFRRATVRIEVSTYPIIKGRLTESS